MNIELSPSAEQRKETAPFCQCPHCRTIWLVPGLDRLNHYRCKVCGGDFDPAQTRCEGVALGTNGSAPQRPAAPASPKGQQR